jgi:nitrite reductase (NADH) small subunit
METWKTVCRVDDIPRLGARRYEQDGFIPVAIFRAADDAIFALHDRCPHKGGPLSQGIVFGHSVACPLHNWTIGLEDGCAAAPDQGCTARIDVRLVDGAVQLNLEQRNLVQRNLLQRNFAQVDVRQEAIKADRLG